MIPESATPAGIASPELLELELCDDSPARGTPPTHPQAHHRRVRTSELPRDRCQPQVDGPSGPADGPSGRIDGVTARGGGVSQVDALTGQLGSVHVPGVGGEAPAEEGVSEPTATDSGEDGESLPGSPGEHLLQAAYGTRKRARRFYDEQVLDHLNPRMREFAERMEMAFVATADGNGECDSSLRAGPPGFIQVLDEHHLAYPEYRGNGVMASLGNISENPHIGILLVDFVTDLIGLHVNGKARVVEDAELRGIHPGLPSDFERGRAPERWVVVQVEEAYIHCRKHIPRMVPVLRQRAWGTDDTKRKGGDYFAAKGTDRPWNRADEPAAASRPATANRESPAQGAEPAAAGSAPAAGEPEPSTAEGADRPAEPERPLAGAAEPSGGTHWVAAGSAGGASEGNELAAPSTQRPAGSGQPRAWGETAQRTHRLRTQPSASADGARQSADQHIDAHPGLTSRGMNTAHWTER